MNRWNNWISEIINVTISKSSHIINTPPNHTPFWLTCSLHDNSLHLPSKKTLAMMMATFLHFLNLSPSILPDQTLSLFFVQHKCTTMNSFQGLIATNTNFFYIILIFDFILLFQKKKYRLEIQNDFNLPFEFMDKVKTQPKTCSSLEMSS